MKIPSYEEIRDGFQMFLGLFFLMFIFGGCVYSMGYPWNCEQAKSATQKAEQEEQDAFDEFDKKHSNKSSKEKELDLRIAINNAMYAKQDENSKCSKY